ncbi:hypothetical protein [uncultured Tateyamaria sp.]|uniref:hypothetical protein n=1 Tax=uncultured Tateyamaria sp. TaxID=455651 RepID=UPI0026046BFD|nr:hypothetical protein [uncultured Tateyamaria sp.]
MRIDRTTLRNDAKPGRAFCLLDCDGCTGMCLSLYMMLTRDEQDEMVRAYKAGDMAVTRH